jgi:DNA-binding NarL/FixJ family response regulator
MNQPPTRIIIVDDHELVRKGLRSFLDLEQDLVIVGEAGTVAEAVALVERLHPQLVLLDMKLPDASGMEACRRLLAVAPQLRILVLTSYAEDATIVAAVQSGAHGYILKDVRTDDLIRAIRTVAEGRGYLDPRIAQQALHWIRTSPRAGGAHPRRMAQLSPQERLIMPLLAEGKTNKEIATQLRLSDKTVKNYLANIFDKLHVKRRAEAVAWFVKDNPSGYTTRNT